MHRLIRLDPITLDNLNNRCANAPNFEKSLAPSLSVVIDNDKLHDGVISNPNTQNFRTRKWRLNDDPVIPS